MKRLAIACIAIFSVASVSVEAATESSKADYTAMDILADVRIPLRDGVELSGRVWTPAGGKPAPVVFVYTPYISDEGHTRAPKFVKRGYAYVSVDKRGRGASGGEFSPEMGAGPDGCQVIDWIKQQPWSNGKVVMRGGSYRGMVQWQIAAKCPGSLAAMVPTAAAYAGEDFPGIQNEIMYSYSAQWLGLVSGRTYNGRLFSDGAYWSDKFR